MSREPAFASLDRFTQRQFARFAEERSARGDLHRYELIDGRIIMNPPAGWPHGEEASNLGFLLKRFVKAKKSGRVFDSSQGFELPSGETVAPDVTFVSNKRWKTFDPPERGRFLRGVPDLVIEVHSASTRRVDLAEKRSTYERNGVLEYWQVDSDAQRITVLTLQAGRYEVAEVAEKSRSARSRVLPGFRTRLTDVFVGAD